EASKRALADPEVRARMSKGQQARHEAALAWCPDEFRDDYDFLKRRLSAHEARAIIEDQIAHAGELTLALCWQCNRTVDDPACGSCTHIGCPLAREVC
ncbi:MAG: hypothetical protein ACOY45_08385, partial [Pseudomonadota bacterium]